MMKELRISSNEYTECIDDDDKCFDCPLFFSNNKGILHQNMFSVLLFSCQSHA